MQCTTLRRSSIIGLASGWLAVGFMTGCNGAGSGQGGPGSGFSQRAEALEVSEAIEIDPSVHLGPSAEGSNGLAMASDGTDYVASWCASHLGGQKRWIARFSSDGTALDDPPLEVSQGCSEVVIAHADAGYVIVSRVARGLGGTYPADLYTVNLSAAGALSQPQLVASDVNRSELPAIASAGDQLMLVWSSAVDTPDVFALRLNPDGTAAVGAPVASNTDDAAVRSPMVAFNGTNFLVAWHAGNDVVGYRYPTDALPIESAARSLIAGGSLPIDVTSLASAGGNFVISYSEQAQAKLRAKVLSADLQPLADLDLANDLNETRAHALAASGTQAVVLWSTRDDTQHAAFIDASNARRSGSTFKVSDTFRPAQQLAPIAGGYVAGWWGAEGGGFLNRKNVWQALISSTGQVGGVTNLSPRVNAQRQPATAFDGQSHLVVWQDFRGVSDFDIYAAQISPEGAITGTPRPLVEGIGDQEHPALAFNGTNFLLAWNDKALSQVMSMALDAAGNPISEPRGITQLDRPSAVASDGNGFMVVGSGYGDGIFAAPEDATGAALAEPYRSGQSEFAESEVKVAWGGHYLVVWANESEGVVAIRFSANGELVDQKKITIATRESLGTSFGPVEPQVAFGGGVYLVAFSTDLGDKHFAVRLDPDGTVLDPVAIELPTEEWVRGVAVSFDGQAFVVSYTGTEHLGISRVSPNGSLLEHTSADYLHWYARHMSLSSACNGPTQLIYDEYTTDAETRLFGRTLQPQVDGPSTGCEPAPPLAFPGGAAGASGSGGGSGSGGSSSSTGGTAGAAGSAGASGDASSASEDDGGCGCRTAPEPAAPRSLALLLAPLALVLRRRRWARRAATARRV